MVYIARFRPAKRTCLLKKDFIYGIHSDLYKTKQEIMNVGKRVAGKEEEVTRFEGDMRGWGAQANRRYYIHG